MYVEWMDVSDAKDFLRLVSAECERRAALLPEGDDGYHQWMFTDLPFLHDLCILYLIAVRHHVERQLLFFASQATEHGNRITHEEFIAVRDSIATKRAGSWKEIVTRLKPETCARYETMETLRLLANSYKHDPHMKPMKELLERLRLDTTRNYMPLPESFALKEGLARFVGLPDDADFWTITHRYVEHAEEFLNAVKTQNRLSPIKPRRFDFRTDIGH